MKVLAVDKDGHLDWCDFKSIGDCNHIHHQRIEFEGVTDFCRRMVTQGILDNSEKEREYKEKHTLYKALEILNKELGKQERTLDLEVCGGFAIFQYHSMISDDIDNTKELDPQIKEIISSIQEDFEEGEIEEDWLNDAWYRFGSKSVNSRIIDEHIRFEKIPTIIMSNLTVTFATFESLIAMKYYALIERTKIKDKYDFEMLFRSKPGFKLKDFIEILRSHKIKQDIEDIPTELYLMGIITEEECTEYLIEIEGTNNK